MSSSPGSDRSDGGAHVSGNGTGAERAPTDGRPRDERWPRRLGALASGVALALAFPGAECSPLAWIALVPLLWSALGSGTALAFRVGWIGGVVFFLATLYWLVFTIGTYTNLSPLVSVGPLLLLCAFLACFFGIFAAGCELARQRSVDLVWVAPALWTVLEWVRTYILGGFPWVALGYSQYRASHLIQFAELTGIYGVSALVVLVNVMVYRGFRGWRDGDAPRTGGMMALTALLVVLVAWGSWRVHGLATAPPAGTLRVGLIQGNVQQDVKWDPAYQESTIDGYAALTAEAVAAGAELVVWPETAAPFFFQDESELRERVIAHRSPATGSGSSSAARRTATPRAPSRSTIGCTWCIPTARPIATTTRCSWCRSASTFRSRRSSSSSTRSSRASVSSGAAPTRWSSRLHEAPSARSSATRASSPASPAVSSRAAPTSS